MQASKKFFVNKKGSVFLKLLLWAVLIVGIISALSYFSSPVKSAFYTVSYPVEKAFWSAGSSLALYCNSFWNVGYYASENENLKIEKQSLLAEIASLQAIVTGNQDQLNVSLSCQDDGFNLKMAGVTGLDAEDIITINKGLEDGILKGMPVINQQKALFGKVSKVYKNFAEVELISSKNSVVNVKVSRLDTPESEIDGVIKGKEGLSIYLDLVPVDDTINEGDVIVTSALEGTYPRDLLVGTITKVDKNDQSPHQQAVIRPFFNIKTDNLFVITNYKQAGN